LGAWQYRGIIGYDNDAYSAQRTIAVNRTPRLANSKTHANSISLYNEISYSFKSHDLTLQPLVALQMGWLHRNGFTEQGLNTDGQNLSIDGRTLYSLNTLAGLRARYEMQLNDGLKAQFEVRTLYNHDFGTRQQTVGGRFANGNNALLMTSDRPDQRDAGILGASLSLLNANSLNFYLDYNGEIRSGQQAHFFSAGVRYSW
jgi:outer membrane autotransporter protein